MFTCDLSTLFPFCVIRTTRAHQFAILRFVQQGIFDSTNAKLSGEVRAFSSLCPSRPSIRSWRLFLILFRERRRLHRNKLLGARSDAHRTPSTSQELLRAASSVRRVTSGLVSRGNFGKFDAASHRILRNVFRSKQIEHKHKVQVDIQRTDISNSFPR